MRRLPQRLAARYRSREERELGAEIVGWEITERDGIPRLEKVFRFRNFADAVAFTNQIGALAEDQGHHPTLITEWGRVTVSWWTHKIRGLHRNDFVMAAKTDDAAIETEGVPTRRAPSKGVAG